MIEILFSILCYLLIGACVIIRKNKMDFEEFCSFIMMIVIGLVAIVLWPLIVVFETFDTK